MGPQDGASILGVFLQFGASAAALVVMWMALKYIRSRDDDQQKVSEASVSAITRLEEKITGSLENLQETLKEMNDDHRQTVQNLFTLNRETISAMYEFKTEVKAEVAIIKAKLDQLTGKKGGTA